MWKLVKEAGITIAVEEAVRIFFPLLVVYVWFGILCLLVVEVCRSRRGKKIIRTAWGWLFSVSRYLAYGCSLLAIAGVLWAQVWIVRKAHRTLESREHNSNLEIAHDIASLLKGNTEKKPTPIGKPPMTDLGLHSPSETLSIPPNSKAMIGNGPLDPENESFLKQMDEELTTAKRHVANEPEKIVLKDLFWTDFSVEGTSIRHAQRLFTEAATKQITPLDYAVVWKLQDGTKTIVFYVPFTNDTFHICRSLANDYRTVLDNWLEKRTEATRAPGDSGQVTSEHLVLGKNIYVYHATFLSPQQVIAVTRAWKSRGATVILRGDDYLAGKKKDAQIKLLQQASP